MTVHCRMLLCAAVLLQTLLLSAQPAALQPGETVEAVLAAGESHRYRLALLEWTLLSFHAQPLEGSALDPMIALYNSAGALVAKNDDYAHPDELAAVIQALVMQRSETYTVEVSGFGGTAGGYRLAVLPGYDRLAVQDSAMAADDWQPIFGEAQVRPLPAGGLAVEMSGVSSSAAWLAQHFAPGSDFYFELSFADVSAATGWQAGIVFAYISSSAHYRLLLSKAGYWRIERVDGSDIEVVSDWNTHPAIAPGAADFRLGILTSGPLMDVIYNGQVLGTVADERMDGRGAVGIFTRTDAYGSRLSMTLQQALMTLPTRVDDRLLFPQHILPRHHSLVADALARHQLVPSGGELQLTVPQGIVRGVAAGVTRLPIASGVRYGEFVLNARLSYEMWPAANGGCGIIFHYADGENYALAYVNAAGEYGLARRRGAGFESGIYGQGLDPQRNSHSLLVIVSDERVYYYIDGTFAGTMSYAPAAGEVGAAVVNFEAVNTDCTFDNFWLWSLDGAA